MQGAEPAGLRHDVGVEEGHEGRAHLRQPGVACGGGPATDRVPHQPGTELAGHRAQRRRVARAVVDDHDREVRWQHGQQPGDLTVPVAHRDHDGHVPDVGVLGLRGAARGPHGVGQPAVEQQPGDRGRVGVVRDQGAVVVEHPVGRGPQEQDRSPGADEHAAAVAPLGAGAEPDREAVRQPGRAHAKPAVGGEHRAVHDRSGGAAELDHRRDLVGGHRPTGRHRRRQVGHRHAVDVGCRLQHGGVGRPGRRPRRR